MIPEILPVVSPLLGSGVFALPTLTTRSGRSDLSCLLVTVGEKPGQACYASVCMDDACLSLPIGQLDWQTERDLGLGRYIQQDRLAWPRRCDAPDIISILLKELMCDQLIIGGATG
jgi:hypothetical protein